MKHCARAMLWGPRWPEHRPHQRLCLLVWLNSKPRLYCAYNRGLLRIREKRKSGIYTGFSLKSPKWLRG